MYSKKILIVGFEKQEITYPHLKQFVDYFTNVHSSDYLYFPERGYFLGVKSSNLVKSLIRNMFILLLILKGIIKLLIAKFYKYDAVIAVDNFAYIICSFIFKNTILWSHDFVTNDQEHSSTLIQKLIAAITLKTIKNKKKIIIQDKRRLNIFAETYLINQDDLEVFYLPVSTLKADYISSTFRASNIPNLLQIGGINQYRSRSKTLIDNYQLHNNNYNLFLHGFFNEDIIKEISTCRHIPYCSTLVVKSSDVYKIVEKCDIGFVCYESQNANFYHISHASGQFVEFIKCGKPVIVMGKTNLKQFVDNNKLGVSIDSIDGLPAAITNIVNNYDFYSKNSIECFLKIFNLDIYLGPLYEWIK